MRSNEIISAAFHNMMEDNTYVKMSVATSFIHAVIVNCLFLFYLFNYSTVFSKKTPLWALVHDYIEAFQFDNSFIWRLIVIGLILFIGYELIPPIGEAAMIYHLDEAPEKKDGFRALAKWLYKFFPMFEYGLSTSLFKASVIILVLVRLILLDLRDNTLIFIMMCIWIAISFFVSLLLPYTKMFICLQWLPFFDAMKKSVSMSIQNIWITVKFVVISFLLSIRFLFNMAIVIWIPIALVSLWAWFGLQDIGRLNSAFLIILIWLIFVAAYIEWIIEWFFTAAWMKIYKTLESEEDLMD
jgi:hypothetical protein